MAFSPYVNPYVSSRLTSMFAPPETADDTRKRFLSGVIPFKQNQAPDVMQPAAPPVETSPPVDPASQYYDELRRLSERRGPSRTAYDAAVMAPPDREDPQYKRHGMARIMGIIGAGAVGFNQGAGAGIAFGEHYNDSPYQDARTDYSQKIKNLGDASDLEEKDKAQEITMLHQARALGLDFDKYKLSQLEFEQKKKKEAADFGIAQQNAASLAKTRADANKHYVPQADGSILQVNPDGTQRVIPGNSVEGKRLKVEQEHLNLDKQKYGLDETNSTNLRGYRDALKANIGKTNTNSATQKEQAITNALGTMSKESQYSEFITADSQGKRTYMSEAEAAKVGKSVKYAQFMKELSRRANQNTPLATDPDDIELLGMDK